MEGKTMTTKKARFPELPTMTPYPKGRCHLCGSQLVRYRTGRAELITCPDWMAGGGFHLPIRKEG